MAVINHGGSLPDTADKTDVYAIIDNGTVTSISNADIASDAAIADTKLAQITTAGKVSGTALVTLGSIPSGGGTIPAVNLPEYSTLTQQSSAPSTAESVGALYTKDSGGQPELFFREESDGDEVQITSGGVLNSGAVVQSVYTITQAITAGATAQIAIDDSKPQVGEGTQVLSRTITPQNASNILKIDIVLFASVEGSDNLVCALFKDGAADCIAATTAKAEGANNDYQVCFTWIQVAGGTDEQTWTVRIGAQGSTYNLNESYGGYDLGVTIPSSITITEIVP